MLDVTSVAVDFDRLAEDLMAESQDDVDLTADWMHALLSLASQELKRAAAPDEPSNAPIHVAA